jgi:hypothetical protein
MLKIGDLKSFNTEGKWFKFETTAGDLRIKLRLLSSDESLDLTGDDILDKMSLKEATKKTRSVLKAAIVGWDILDESGKELEFDKNKLDDPMFFKFFTGLKLKHKGQEYNLGSRIINISSAHEYFIQEGETSFL